MHGQGDETTQIGVKVSTHNPGIPILHHYENQRHRSSIVEQFQWLFFQRNDELKGQTTKHNNQQKISAKL